MNVLVKNEPKRTLAPDLLKRFTAIVGEKYAITDPQMQQPISSRCAICSAARRP